MSRWALEVSEEFERAIRKLDRHVTRRILAGLEEIADSEDPRSRGRALTGALGGLWRYRFGDYRVLVQVEDARLVIIAITAGHRSTVYR
ncbi:MAG: type II toxin-antitoxin system RelE/ParE family toxin [Acidimicrobiia bacterium]|nr:type II toxin-antitoxin system RelE/ParE family toxin [Acidimicrobiia bacterium]